MENTKSTIISIAISFLLVGFSSTVVLSQSDSCSSQLSVGSLVPFDTSSLRCFPAWSSEDFILRYGQSGQNIWSFVLSAPDRSSYISVGFSSNGNMDGSSAMAGWMTANGGPGIAKQYYLGGKSSSACPPDQGSLQLVANSSLIISRASRLYLAFQLTSSQPPAPYLVFAVGPRGSVPSSNGFLATHSNRAASSIDYATGAVSGAGSGGFPAKRWHGLLTILGWGVLMPVGVIMARYFKHLDPLWFYSHISIQGVGFALGLVGIIAGFNLDDNVPGAAAHQAIGICILVCGVLQVMAFLIRPGKAAKVRRYWNWYHHYVGRGAIVLAVANVFLGLSVAHESGSWSVAYVIYLVIWVVAGVLLEVRKHCTRDEDL
ncbi:cytochrome b561 and DOMON domain-containing protein [Canna indica]|uniref:Cytochrome b561 and DOMON domain-containing protein n=1 Tax=Canna indica TaxID=4628 RepID=A0AAQ3QN47_9LILI|nr:cytochrome b561 and DOMON domain-containing protein [Canna indica]